MRKFEDYDYSAMNEWYGARNLKAPPKDCLPKTGLIEDATACGFLVETNCKFAILDFFCSNPNASKEDRLEAIHEIAFLLTLHAKKLGFKGLKCDTRFENIKLMANKQGFDYLGEYSTFFKEIV